MDLNGLSKEVIAAAVEVHRNLGPGLMESVYQRCMAYELTERSIDVKRETALPIIYKDMRIDNAYRVDILVEDCMVLELKVADQVTSLHKAQLLSYLRLADLRLGLIINFNVPVLKQGIRRIANNF